MAINKVIYGNDTLVDLTEDTVAPETLLSGATAHSAAGNQITGTAIPGHTIISSSMLPIGGSTLPMAGRGNLQFGSQYDPVFTEDDPTNNTTIVHGQLFVCNSESDWNTLSDADFKAKYGAYREQVGVYWVRPWANSIAYQTDLTPVGAVLSCAVDTTNTTIFPADLVEFPNKNYLICRGATVKITDYPALYQYFEAEYGDGNYFGTAQTAEGYFVLPNWSADFPTNGILVIKARVTSDVITFAEVDDEAVTAENVWSAEKVDDELNTLDTKIDNLLGSLVYSQTGLSSSNCTIETGGYCQIGKLVIVNVRLVASKGIANNEAVLQGLPLCKMGNNHVVLSVNNPSGYAYLSGSYLIVGVTTSYIAGNIIILSGVYLAR